MAFLGEGVGKEREHVAFLSKGVGKERESMWHSWARELVEREHVALFLSKGVGRERACGIIPDHQSFLTRFFFLRCSLFSRSLLSFQDRYALKTEWRIMIRIRSLLPELEIYPRILVLAWYLKVVLTRVP